MSPTTTSVPVPAPVAGLSFRPGRGDDAPAVHELQQRAYVVDEPQERETLADVEEMYATPWWDAGADGIVAVDVEGVVRAHGQVVDRPGQVRTRQAMLFGVVDPAWRRRGVGTALLAWQVARGREHVQDAPSGREAFLRVFAEDQHADRAALLRAAGFDARRWYAAMRRDLSQPHPDAVVPDGLRLVPFDPSDASLVDAVRLAHNDAFASHWGSEPFEPDDWRRRVVEGHGKRPDLSRVLLDRDGGVAGYLMSGAYPDDWEAQGWTEGWVDLLGVCDAHRGRGLGRALLLAAMRAYAEQGWEYAGLGVDVDNPRALRLYTDLGFEVRGRETSWVLPA